jgi:hypothetical protein
MPDDVAIELGLDPHTAVVATTHDPKLDDLALLEALKSPAFYGGALGSRVNSERRKERPAEHFDLSPDQVERLHGPVGLPIDSHTPPEIAVAIVAKMTAVKNGMWAKTGLRPVSVQAKAEWAFKLASCTSTDWRHAIFRALRGRMSMTSLIFSVAFPSSLPLRSIANGRTATSTIT